MIEEKNRFSEFVEATLKQAGWFQGRGVPNLVTEWNKQLAEFFMFQEAKTVLMEFGGIHINQRGAGETCAREPFIINPTLAKYEDDRFGVFAEQLKTNLYPLGEVANGHYFLAIGEDKRVF